MFEMFFSYLDMSLPFFEADGYNGIEKEMTKVFDATQEFAKEENNLFKNLDQNDIAQLEKKNQKNVDVFTRGKYVLARGTSILGEVRYVEISRVTQQLLCSKSSRFCSSTLKNQSNCTIFNDNVRNHLNFYLNLKLFKKK